MVLRGVAAILVLWYHVFEGYAFAAGAPIIAMPNHAYLAVDFFFILSGFVIAYAYDDRIGKSMPLGNFFKRRLIRLHPMVVLGAVFGVITFLMQGSVQWDGTHVMTSAVMIALLCTMFFIPAVPGCYYEIRGNGEMFPLNGPAWSLFFEYIGNILYALFIHRFSNRALAIWTALMGIGLGFFTLTDFSGYGNLGVGWTLDATNFIGGLLRMLFPFSLGMLVFRHFKPAKIRGAFWICSLILFVLFHVPFIPGLAPHLLQRAVRNDLHHTCFSSFGVVGCIGINDRQILFRRLQIFRRHLLPRLYHPLSPLLSVLCLVDQEPVLHLRSDVGNSHFADRRKYRFGMVLSEDIR